MAKPRRAKSTPEQVELAQRSPSWRDLELQRALITLLPQGPAPTVEREGALRRLRFGISHLASAAYALEDPRTPDETVSHAREIARKLGELIANGTGAEKRALVGLIGAVDLGARLVNAEDPVQVEVAVEAAIRRFEEGWPEQATYSSHAETERATRKALFRQAIEAWAGYAKNRRGKVWEAVALLVAATPLGAWKPSTLHAVWKESRRLNAPRSDLLQPAVK